MTKHGDLAKAFAAAAEVVKNVPKHLHEVAFTRALDHILGRGSGTPTQQATRKVATRRDAHRQEDQSEFSQLLGAIDRTRHADVGATTRVADRALKVLQLANDDYGVDGLTAPEIAEILTSKLRLPVSANTVNMALERETETVNVRTKAGVKTFHLMAPGEDYLRQLRSGDRAPRARRMASPKPRTKPMRSEERTAKPVKATGTKSPGSSSGKKVSGRPGPKSAVAQLLAAGYFKTPRTIGDVQGQLKHNRGHSYSVQELAPALVRSLRDGSLTRERNKSGQYEYAKA